MRLACFALVLFVAACSRSQKAEPSDAAAPAASSASQGEASATRVLEQGHEPRTAMRFAFVPGRRERAVLELDSQRRSQGGETLSEEHVTLRLAIAYTATDRVELELSEAETTARDIPRIKSTKGLRSVHVFHPQGEAEMPELTPPPAADPRAAEYVKGAIMQVASNLLPALPKEPVGKGARWIHSELRFELVEQSREKFIIERRSGHHGPTRLATGEEVFVSEEQVYRLEARPDGIARHVEAVLDADQPGNTKLVTRLRWDVGD